MNFTTTYEMSTYNECVFEYQDYGYVIYNAKNDTFYGLVFAENKKSYEVFLPLEKFFNRNFISSVLGVKVKDIALWSSTEVEVTVDAAAHELRNEFHDLKYPKNMDFDDLCVISINLKTAEADFKNVYWCSSDKQSPELNKTV